MRRRKPPWYSYEAATSAAPSRAPRSERPVPCASASGVASSARIPRKPLRRKADRARPAVATHRAAGRGLVADETSADAALDAAVQVRQVARRPRGASAGRTARAGRGPAVRARATGSRRAGRGTGQSHEGTVVRLLLGKEAQHRLGADQPDREPVRVLARPWCDARRSAPVTVCSSPEPWCSISSTCEMRLEAGAEARLCPPHPLRDRADASAVGRVDVQDPVGLAEPERAEHDRLRPIRARHPPSLRRGRDGARRRARRLCVGTTQDAIDRHGHAGNGETLCCFNTSSQSGWQRGQNQVPRPATRDLLERRRTVARLAGGL